MLEFGERIARSLVPGSMVYLQGDLGAGKTTIVRGVLRGLGHTGPVTSPTYTLLESYQPGEMRIHHFDLYRLEDPEELEHIGIRDLLDGEAIALVEWPAMGTGILPPPDLVIQIGFLDRGRRIETSGSIVIAGGSLAPH